MRALMQPFLQSLMLVLILLGPFDAPQEVSATRALETAVKFWENLGAKIERDRPDIRRFRAGLLDIWVVSFLGGKSVHISVLSGTVTAAYDRALEERTVSTHSGWISAKVTVENGRLHLSTLARRLGLPSGSPMASYTYRPIKKADGFWQDERQGYAAARFQGLVNGYPPLDAFYGMTVSADIFEGKLMSFSQNWTYPPVQKTRVLISERQAKSLLLGKKLAELGPKAKATLGWLKTSDGKSARLAWRVDFPAEHKDFDSFVDAETGALFSR